VLEIAFLFTHELKSLIAKSTNDKVSSYFEISQIAFPGIGFPNTSLKTFQEKSGRWKVANSQNVSGSPHPLLDQPW
jgi:hypothetical protein